jgi:hypothetical protein
MNLVVGMKKLPQIIELDNNWNQTIEDPFYKLLRTQASVDQSCFFYAAKKASQC